MQLVRTTGEEEGGILTEQNSITNLIIQLLILCLDLSPRLLVQICFSALILELNFLSLYKLIQANEKVWCGRKQVMGTQRWKKKKKREPYLEFTEESSKVKGACVFGTKERKGILKSECSDDDYADPE